MLFNLHKLVKRALLIFDMQGYFLLPISHSFVHSAPALHKLSHGFAYITGVFNRTRALGYKKDK